MHFSGVIVEVFPLSVVEVQLGIYRIIDKLKTISIRGKPVWTR